MTCLKIFESFFKINHSQALLKIKLSDGSATKYNNDIQIIIVNNDYTSEIKEEDIIIRFDGDGTKGIDYGLINDIQN